MFAKIMIYPLLLMFLVSINLIFRNHLSKLSKPKDDNRIVEDPLVIICFLLFGPLCYFFIEPIKKYRWRRYTRNAVSYYKTFGLFTEKTKQLELSIKLDKLKQKSKNYVIK